MSTHGHGRGSTHTRTYIFRRPRFARRASRERASRAIRGLTCQRLQCARPYAIASRSFFRLRAARLLSSARALLPLGGSAGGSSSSHIMTSITSSEPWELRNGSEIADPQRLPDSCYNTPVVRAHSVQSCVVLALRACVVLESVRRRRFAPGSSALRARPAERASRAFSDVCQC